MFLFLMLPTGLWGKEKKVPDSYFFTIEVRDALTHRSIDGAQVYLKVVKDSLNRQIAGRTNKDGVAEFTADSGADKYTFRISYNGGPKKLLWEYEPESVEYTISD
ncbi:MAG: carboxypeptidase-like regulatory domain-containing protein, partial [Paramuribaculum sp.]|nr:carboxypeptidase-like regulatory domain-containing protein [Paramuribaculum sp.]